MWPDKADTLAQGLVFIDSAGNAVIKLGNTMNGLYPSNEIRFGKLTSAPAAPPLSVLLTNR
jgi:hypothetical protein